MQRRLKGFSFQIPVNYLNDIKLYNSKMGELIASLWKAIVTW